MGINPITAASMKELDEIASRDFCIAPVLLMAFAGRSVADFIVQRYPDKKKVAIFSGKGNNGGDGFAAALHLHNAGFLPVVYFDDDPALLTRESRTFYDIASRLNILVNKPGDSADIVLDCLSGAGFAGDARGKLNEKIEIINSLDALVVSVDMPSGLQSDGFVGDGLTAVHADITLAIGRPKLNSVLYPGKQYCGEVVTIDAGFPRELIERDESLYLFDRAYARSILTFNNDPMMHKGKNGRLLIAGGFPGYEGAALMTAGAAVETGTGLITILTNNHSRDIIAGRLPEAMTLSIDEFDTDEKLLDMFSKRVFDAVVLGPGLSRTPEAGKFFVRVMTAIESSGVKGAVIDADGLFFLKEYLPLKNGSKYILTPHAGEAKALSGIDDYRLKGDRLGSALEIARYTGAAILMKGASTVTTDGRKSFINTSGNNLLATGGSGDILSGIIGAFIAKGLTALEAGALGAYVHGRCADMSLSEKSFSIRATDIPRNISAVLSETVFE